MLADILPTGYEVGVLNGRVQPGDTVVVVGSRPGRSVRHHGSQAVLAQSPGRGRPGRRPTRSLQGVRRGRDHQQRPEATSTPSWETSPAGWART